MAAARGPPGGAEVAGGGRRGSSRVADGCKRERFHFPSAAPLPTAR